MSKLKRDLYRKKLRKLLSRADDEAFLQLIWAVDALQSERAMAAARFIQFPPEAETSEVESQFAVRKWELETLVGQLLVTPKCQIREGPNKRTNCEHFSTAAAVVNHLRDLENAESGILLKHTNILLEMHRTGQRQFPWQRGFYNVNRLYRYAMIYGQGECGSYFERANDLSINDFFLIGFAMHASFQKSPWLAHNNSIEQLGVKRVSFDAGLKLLSVPIEKARTKAVSLTNEAGRGLPTAYQPSFLRRFPVVSFGNDNERLCAPLPQLIPLRITSGLYYDLVPGGQKLLNEANDRFERYVYEYIAAMMPRFDVSRSYRYGPKGAKIDSPDIIVRDNDQISVAIECKATKLTFPAQYAEDPTSIAQKSYDQIAKGVFQLWKYFSHLRRGVAGTESVSPSVRGIVLTLDTWLVMARELQQDVLASAEKLARDDVDITDEDRRAITFCTIDDLEDTISCVDEDSFIRALDAVDEDAFVGWLLPNICRRMGLGNEAPKPFPFRLADVLPWWDATLKGLAPYRKVLCAEESKE